MASWEDGPEYAPVARPSVFAPPSEAVPLSYAAPVQRPSANAPLARPDFTQQEQARPLDEYVPTRDSARDPSQAFKTASATMTAVDSAWGAVHQHQAPVQPNWPAPTGAPAATGPAAPVGPQAPTEPITLSRAREGAQTADTPAFPPPTGAPLDHPPPSGAPVSAPEGPGLPGWAVDPNQPAPPPQQWDAPEQWPTPQGLPELFLGIQRSMTPAMLWALVGGSFLLPFSPLLFSVAATASTYAQHRRRWVRNIFIIGGAVIATVFVVGLFAGGIARLGAWWNLVSWTSVFVCILTLASTVWLVSNAVSRGEPPEQVEEY